MDQQPSDTHFVGNILFFIMKELSGSSYQVVNEVFKTPRGSHQSQGFFYKVFLILQECVKKEMIRYYLLRFLSPLLVRFFFFHFKSLDREAFPCPQLGGADRGFYQICGPTCPLLPWGSVETDSLVYFRGDWQ